jgi:hypothetical protein
MGDLANPKLAKLAAEANRLHNLIVEGNQSSLQRSIEAGTFLIEAKKIVGHGDWGQWLVKNCPQISDRTARLYMQLANEKNVKKIEEAADQNGNGVTELSLSGARRLLIKPKTEEEKAKAKAKAERERKAKDKEEEARVAVLAGANLADVMNAKGTDEIKTALKHSARSEEVIAAITPSLKDLLKNVSPAELAILLTSTSIWPAENVPALIDAINKRKSSSPQMSYRAGSAQQPEARAQ